MKIVVDTNIIFSGILNSSGRIGKILLHSKHHFQFYSCYFLKTEMLKHRGKLQTRTGLTNEEIAELESMVIKNITFINEGLIPENILFTTEKLLSDIDINDTPFVALSKHLKAKLWTGDKQLVSGLRSKKFKEVITTAELSELLDKLESK